MSNNERVYCKLAHKKNMAQKHICEMYRKLISKEEFYIDEYYSYLDFIKEKNSS